MGWINRLFGHTAANQAPPPAPADAPEAEPPPVAAPPADGESYTLDEVLAPYRERVEALARPCVDIALDAVPEADHSPLEPDGMETRASKVGGVPFSPETWPADEDGKRLAFVAQVNFAEAPPLEGLPREGILQVFEFDDRMGRGNRHGVVRFYDGAAARLEHVPDPGGCGTDHAYPAVERPSRMRLTAGTSGGSAEDLTFRQALAGIGLDTDAWYDDERYDGAHEELYGEFPSDGHRLGGYAAFTQSDPRNPKSPDVHVLQLDSDEGVRFGDMGIAHVFIPPAALAAGDWSQAYYYWDCS